jgi:hydrogenase maturation protease
MPVKTLILGLGNDLYGDDGIGLHIVRMIQDSPARLDADPKQTGEIDLQPCSLTGLSILDEIVGYDNLIIIDTIKRENPVTGRIRIMEEEDVRHIPGPSPHYVSLPQMIEIGRRLGLKVPGRIKIIAVEAKNMYNLGEGLTPEMKKAVPDILSRLNSILRKLNHE